MPWWAFAYIAVVGALGGAGIADDVRSERAPAHIAGGVLSLVAIAVMVSAVWRPVVAESIGVFIAIPLVFAVGFDLWSGWTDIQDAEDEDDVTATMMGVGLVMLVETPAFACGVLALVRAL